MDILQLVSPWISLIAAGTAMYVSYRLATFENRLIRRLNGTYLRSDLAKSQYESDQRDHKRYEKELDNIWRTVKK